MFLLVTSPVLNLRGPPGFGGARAEAAPCSPARTEGLSLNGSAPAPLPTPSDLQSFISDAHRALEAVGLLKGGADGDDDGPLVPRGMMKNKAEVEWLYQVASRPAGYK